MEEDFNPELKRASDNFACNYCIKRGKKSTVYEGEECYEDGKCCADKECIKDYLLEKLKE
jgi:hypothetical protein